MLEVRFYNLNEIDDALLRFAVIVSKYNDKWIYCKHKDRDTWEIPGGHREAGEPILETAKRELFEETGAIKFDIKPICIYSVVKDDESFGMLFYASIIELASLPDTEIEKIDYFHEEPNSLTYPEIQPKLFQKAQEALYNWKHFLP